MIPPPMTRMSVDPSASSEIISTPHLCTSLQWDPWVIRGNDVEDRNRESFSTALMITGKTTIDTPRRRPYNWIVPFRNAVS